MSAVEGFQGVRCHSAQQREACQGDALQEGVRRRNGSSQVNASTTPGLSNLHGPVGSLLSTHASPERRQTLPLSDQQD